MKDNMYSDLKIQGFGEGNGGIYQTIDIKGHGTLLNNTECESFQTDGISQVKGNLDTVRVNIRGMTTILGNFTSHHARISGKADVKGNIRSDFIHADGDLTSKGNCITKDFINKGTVKCGGFLEAEKVAIKMYGQCSINEIHAGKVAIERAHKNNNVIQGIFNMIKSKLKVHLIEADDLYLEYTHAEVVRGGKITIGKGCEIGRVEYFDTFEKDPDSRVKETNHVL